MGSRVSKSAQDLIPKHFACVSTAEMEAETCPDAPSDDEVRSDAFECTGGQADQCLSSKMPWTYMQKSRTPIFPSMVRSCMDGWPN